MTEEQLELFPLNPEPPQIKYMDLTEFRNLGFLQEANRQFFHPLGLALEVVLDEEEGSAWLGKVWDYREDPEGMMFAESLDKDKAQRVAAERAKHAEVRVQMLGDVVQPLA